MKNNQDYSTFQQRIDKLYEMKRFKDCVKMCKEVIALFPDEWRPYYTLVSSYYNSRHIKNAYDTALEAIQRFPDNHYFWLSMGQILYFSKKYEEALVWLHKALGKVPENVIVYALLSECYQRQGDYSIAVSYAMKALAIDPNHEVALRALAWSKVSIDSPQASSIVENYLQCYPNSFEAHHVAAVFFLKKKQKEKAVEHFRAALRVQPDREKAFTEHKDFLLEYVPEYYIRNKPVMKGFVALMILGVSSFLFAKWMDWQIVSECAVGFQILVAFYFLMTRNDFIVRLRKESIGLSKLFKTYKVDLLEYGVLLLCTMLSISELLLFDWVKMFNILMVSVIYAPKSTFLRRTSDASNRFYPHYLLNIYMIGLFLYSFWAEKPLFTHLIVLLVLTVLNVIYEIRRSLREGEAKLSFQ